VCAAVIAYWRSDYIGASPSQFAKVEALQEVGVGRGYQCRRAGFEPNVHRPGAHRSTNFVYCLLQIRVTVSVVEHCLCRVATLLMMRAPSTESYNVAKTPRSGHVAYAW